MLRETFRKLLGPDRRELIPLYGYIVLARNVSGPTYKGGFPKGCLRAVYQLALLGGTISGITYGIDRGVQSLL